MFEHRTKPLLPRKVFVLRMLRTLALALGIIGVSLGLGIFGYHFCAGLSWLDALLNAAMILTGMGPVNELHTVGGKLFASFYALFSGVVFITAVALLLAPVFHRFLHKFHLESGSPEGDRKERRPAPGNTASGGSGSRGKGNSTGREAGRKSGGPD